MKKYKEKDVSMNIYAIDGHKVVVNTFNAGHDYQVEIIKKHFKIGHILTVEHTDVYNSNTDVYFHEVPNIAFNSVFFSDVKKQSKKNDKKNPYYKIYNK